MTLKHLLLTLIAAMAMPQSLVLAQEPTPEAVAKTGLENWAKLKDTKGKHYRYTISQSSFTGAGNKTTVTVKDGKVIERAYEAFTPGPPVPVPPGQEPPENKSAWTETGANIGSHKEGAPALTLDEIYAKAPEIASRQGGESEKCYAKLNDDGLITLLFWVDTRIADDAPQQGIVLSGIEWLTE